MTSIMIDNLEKVFKGKKAVLFIGIGFDPRSLSIIEHIPKAELSRVFAICNNRNTYSQADDNKRKLIELTNQHVEIIGDGSETTIEVIDQIQAILRGQINITDEEIFVDISVLSHELLIAFIGLIANERLLNRITLLYTKASEYGFNSGSEKLWLSRGVSDIRSVLGFPGVMLPSRRLHLIIMAGFELERAAEIVRRYEPSRLSIAWGSKDQSIHEKHHVSNLHSANELHSFFEAQDDIVESIHKFEFSCISPSKTADAIIKHIAQYPKENTVIVPLNTKLSAVGAALAALHNQEIQICYAQPVEYNSLGYAKPSDSIEVVQLGEIIDESFS